MPIERRTSRANLSLHRIAPPISIDGNKLTVDQATIKYNGKDHSLPASQYIIQPRAAPVHVTATYLRRVADDSLYLYIQEAPDQAPLDYDRDANAFVHMLFFFDVPAGVTNFDKLTVVTSTVE